MRICKVVHVNRTRSLRGNGPSEPSTYALRPQVERTHYMEMAELEARKDEP